MKDTPLITCPSCMEQTLQRVPTLPHFKEYDVPIEMHSLACAHPDDVRDFKIRNPNIQCSDDPAHPLFGVPVVKSRNEKLSVLKKEGWQENN